LDEGYYKEAKLALPSTKKLSYLWESSGAKKYLRKTLSTKTKLLLKPRKEVLKQLRLGASLEEVMINDWILRKHFSELTYFFLSIFKDDIIQKILNLEEALKSILKKDTKFNSLYVKNKKKTQSLYMKFVKTKTFKNFLESGLTSTLLK